MAPRFAFRIDPPVEEAAVEAGRLLFARECRFVIGALAIEQLPAGDTPEICFAGRSNVGKSSLVNALTGRKTLARASNTPGRTQQLNFFELDGRLRIVDLPGYGHAEAPKPLVTAWQKLLKSYLRGRRQLTRVFLLIDGRHGPKKADVEIMTLLAEAAVSFQAVLTKADKPNAAELAAAIAATETELLRHPSSYPEIRVTSSETLRGVPELRATIAALLAA